MYYEEEFKAIEKMLSNNGFEEVSLDTHNCYKAEARGYLCVVSPYSVVEDLRCGLKMTLNSEKNLGCNHMPLCKNDKALVEFVEPMKVFFKKNTSSKIKSPKIKSIEYHIDNGEERYDEIIEM